MSVETVIRLPVHCPECGAHFQKGLAELYARDLVSCIEAALANLPTIKLPAGARPSHG